MKCVISQVLPSRTFFKESFIKINCISIYFCIIANQKNPCKINSCTLHDKTAVLEGEKQEFEGFLIRQIGQKDMTEMEEEKKRPCDSPNLLVKAISDSLSLMKHNS